MAGFIKYQHIERLGTDEVDGLRTGDVYFFPKLDGANAQIWYSSAQAQLYCASRNRILSLDHDNHGFMKWAVEQLNLVEMCQAHPDYRFFGEWLVPHVLKTYMKDAWHRFYIFDVLDPSDNYLPYNEYLKFLGANADYVPLLRIICNPSLDDCQKVLKENTFLIQNEQGIGEGIVLKNYAFTNKYGRTTWGKLINNEFKAQHTKTDVLNDEMVEERIVEEFLAYEIGQKVFVNICAEMDGWKAQYIARFLGTTWHDFVVENTWQFIKKYKNPTVNFRKLHHFFICKIKHDFSELF